MKKLILIRHAKSDWSFDLPDLERPISKRGKNDIKLMSSILNKLDVNLDHIYISKAKRTIQTFEFFKKNKLFLENNFSIEDDLYDFHGDKVLNFIKDVDDSYSSILIFTHNNTCNNLVVKFTNQYLHVPTCGILIFEFNVSLWKDISDSDISYYFPKVLDEYLQFQE